VVASFNRKAGEQTTKISAKRNIQRSKKLENPAVEEDTPIVSPSNDQKCDVKNSPVEITDKPP